VLLLVLATCSGCASPWAARYSLPKTYEVTRGQLIVRSDFALAVHHRLIEDLLARQADLCRHLDLPASDEPIEIYLFEGGQRFEQYMARHYPTLPQRRAFFLETDTRLTVYAQWGDRVAEDLRHEATHAYLHAVVPGLPLWLDEGLAEYYEAPRGNQGLNQQNLRLMKMRLRGGEWRPDLCRLERLPPTADMDLNDYAEAWAWVHFLLHSTPEHRDLLRAYLKDLRREVPAEPISMRLAARFGDPSAALVAHLRSLIESSPSGGEPASAVQQPVL